MSDKPGSWTCLTLRAWDEFKEQQIRSPDKPGSWTCLTLRAEH